MAELELRNLVKIFPFMKLQGLFSSRKKSIQALERQKAQPYTTNEGVIAVQQFNLSVEHGEFLVILGPSGCGKSTLLRMIAGLEQVSDGSIWMNGTDITEIKAASRNIAMIFQNYALYSHLNVFDNIAYPLKNQHVPRHKIQADVMEIAQLLQLTELLTHRPKELSGGEQQRVAIARALIRRPQLFLLDEPFSNLDASLRQHLRKELKRIHEMLGTTFIYVTHDQTDAFILGTKIAVMKNGMIEQIGTPQKLYNYPENAYVATFVGMPHMNMIPAVLRENDGQWMVEAFGKAYVLPQKNCSNFEAKDNGVAVQLGIRPVHIAVEDIDVGNGIKAEIIYIEQTGTEIILHLLADTTELAVVMPKDGLVCYARHKNVSLLLPAQRFHLFDAESGESVGL